MRTDKREEANSRFS